MTELTPTSSLEHLRTAMEEKGARPAALDALYETLREAGCASVQDVADKTDTTRLLRTKNAGRATQNILVDVLDDNAIAHPNHHRAELPERITKLELHPGTSLEELALYAANTKSPGAKPDTGPALKALKARGIESYEEYSTLTVGELVSIPEITPEFVGMMHKAIRNLQGVSAHR